MRETLAESLRRQRMAAVKAASAGTPASTDRSVATPPSSSPDAPSPPKAEGSTCSLREPKVDGRGDLDSVFEALSARSTTQFDRLPPRAPVHDLRADRLAQTSPEELHRRPHGDSFRRRSVEIRATEHGNDAGSIEAARPRTTTEASARGDESSDDGGPELDPELTEFLGAMKERFNPAAISERIRASKEREAQGYEALLTYEMIVENPISENDPALDRMLASRPRIGQDAPKTSTRPGRAYAEGRKPLVGKQPCAPLRAAQAEARGLHKGLGNGLSATRREKLLPMLPES